MKKTIITAVLFFCAAIGTTVYAQDERVEKKEQAERKEKKEKKESQEIIIRRKGEADVKVSVEIKGDKVTINGKPLSDFKDDNVTINRRNIMVFDGNGNKRFDFNTDAFINGVTWNSKDDMPHAFLGVSTLVYTPGGPESGSEGAEITSITEKSPAEKAGLKPGDIITKINDKKITDPESLSDVVGAFKPKEEVTVYYTRDKKEKSSKVILGERRESMAYSFSGPGFNSHNFSFPQTPNMPGSPNDVMDRTGVFGNPGDFTFNRTQKLGIKIQDTEEGNGVKILSVDTDSPAEKAGLKTGDILTEVNGKKITNTDEAREILQENAGKATYPLKAKRDNREMSFDIKIPKKLKTANL